MERHERETYSYGARLLYVEEAVRSYRRRFRLALAGYLLLAVGLVVAFWVYDDLVDDLTDTQRGAIELARCVDHPKAVGCKDNRTYKELLEALQ